MVTCSWILGLIPPALNEKRGIDWIECSALMIRGSGGTHQV